MARFGVVTLAMAGYVGLRLVVEGERGVAVRNTERLLDVDRRLGIDVEYAVQEWVLERDVVRCPSAPDTSGCTGRC